MKVKGIDHVTIMVKDLEEARKRLGDLFGTEFGPPHANKPADVVLSSSPLGILLGAPLSPDGPVARGIAKRGEGLGVLALKVDNIDEAVKEMEAKGVRCVVRHVDKGALFHPSDLYGVLIDLLERD